MPRIQTCSELEDLAQGTAICRKDANGTFNFTATLSMRAHRHRRCPEMFNKWSFVLNAAWLMRHGTMNSRESHKWCHSIDKKACLSIFFISNPWCPYPSSYWTTSAHFYCNTLVLMSTTKRYPKKQIWYNYYVCVIVVRQTILYTVYM